MKIYRIELKTETTGKIKYAKSIASDDIGSALIQFYNMAERDGVKVWQLRLNIYTI